MNIECVLRRPVLGMILALWFGALGAGAIPPDFLIRTWTTDDGLPVNDVRGIAQTPDGYLWLATLHGGLVRFDGVRFVLFDPRNTPVLTTLEMHEALLDGEGTLWIGGVAPWLFSFRDGAFLQQDLGPELGHDILSGVVSVSADEVWLSTQTGRLLRGSGSPDQPRQWQVISPPGRYAASVYWRDDRGDVWYRMAGNRIGRGQAGHFAALPASAAPHGVVLALAVDAQGKVWAGTGQELARWDGERFVAATPTNGEPALSVARIVPAGNHGLWVAANQRLRRIEEGRWVAECPDWDPKFLGGGLLSESYGDRRGGLWLMRRGLGVLHVSAEGQAWRLSTTNGLPGAILNCWFEDREGNIWLGLAGGGLVRLTPRAFRSVPAPNAMLDRPVTSVAEASSGELWVGLANGQVARQRGSEWEMLPVGTEGLDVTVCPGREGEMYIGTVGKGLLVHRGGELSAPFAPEAIGKAVRALLRDRAGRLWIGNEKGLFQWDSQRLQLLQLGTGSNLGLVLALAEDGEGALWIGTARPELWRLKDDEFSVYTPGDETRGQRFWSLLADADGTIWIGTLGGGLLRFRDGQFVRFLPAHGLPSEHISQVIEDEDGYLWLGTRHGICRVSKLALHAQAEGAARKVECVTYDRNDGLPTVECAGGFQPSGWSGRDGRLWFATAKGLVFVQPRDLARNDLPPQVLIEEVWVDGQPADPPPARDRHGNLTLAVVPGRHYFEFHFTGLSFAAPGKVRFQWRLEGLESDWVDGGVQRVAKYGFLAPGRYRFQVRACNNDGVWNETGTALALQIAPFFWQTAWFRMAVWAGTMTLVALVVFGVVRSRQRRKIRLLERKHALEQERARIARDIHDDLGMNLAQIGMLSDYAQNCVPPQTPAHESMNEIFERANEAVRKLDEIVWAINPTHDTLEHLVRYLAKIAREYLSVAAVRCRLDLPETLPADALSAAQRHNLVLAVKEALHNAVRHGAPSEVTLRVRVDDHGLAVVIADNGRGCDPARLMASPRGLANLRQRLEQIRGRVECQSTPGAGTTIRMSLPLHAPKLSPA